MKELNGYTPLKVAQIGFEEHASQTKNYAVKSHGTYDNSKFGLYFTTVGPDVKKNDFLENIDANASADYVAAHAAEIAAYPVWPEPSEADLAALEADAENAADTAEAEEIPDEAAPAEADEDAVDPALPASKPAPPAKTTDHGGSAGLAVAMIVAGVIAVGAGGWYAWRTLFGGRRHRRRRRRIR